MKRLAITGIHLKNHKPDCLEGFGDGPKHCTLPVGHRERCNHLPPTAEKLTTRAADAHSKVTP